jgi:hypothetical protein
MQILKKSRRILGMEVADETKDCFDGRQKRSSSFRIIQTGALKPLCTKMDVEKRSEKKGSDGNLQPTISGKIVLRGS